jgi:hypothetical protein
MDVSSLQNGVVASRNENTRVSGEISLADRFAGGGLPGRSGLG